MAEDAVDLDVLREDIEKLILLEEVAERRQQLIEQRLEQALATGVSTDMIRKELNLSKESIRRLLEQKTPDLAQRLGISQETAENLSESIG